MKDYSIDYCINLGNLYSKNLNSLYNRTIKIYNGDIINSKEELLGYFDYKTFDKEDEIRVKNEVKYKLQDVFNEIIDNKELQTTIKNIVDNMNVKVQSIKLKPIKHKYQESVDFTLYVTF